LEVRLIGRNYDLIGQILEIFKDKRKNKKKKEYSVKGIAMNKSTAKVQEKGW